MNEIFKILLETDCVLLRRTRTRRTRSRFHPRPPPRRKFSFFSSCSREKSIERSREERFGGEKMSKTCLSFSHLSLFTWFLLGFDTLTIMHTNSSFFLSFRRKKKKKDDDFKRDDDVDEKRDFDDDEKEEATDEKI